MATGQLGTQIGVVEGPDNADGDLVGWASVEQPDSLMLQAAPGRLDVADALLRWLLRTAEGPVLTVEVFDGRARDLFTQAGFEPADPPLGFYGMRELGLRAPVAGVSGPVSAGYVMRRVRSDEAGARVAVHRAAWRPVDLPFHPDHRPDLDESWSSSFSLDAYHRVRDTRLYDREFDLVVQAPDGSLAACCIGWFDPHTGWTEIEPLGVVLAHRRRGLAAALCAEVAARTARAGGSHVFINTGPSQRYPAPYRAYRKAGFTPYLRAETLLLRGANE